MLRVCLSVLMALQVLHGADELVKPDRVSLSTWVREDLFAGWIANDTAAFERGAQKVDRYLSEHPNDRLGMGWKYLVVSYAIIQARTKGDDAAYDRQLAAAKELRTRIFTGDPQDAGLNVTVGSCLVRTAYFAADKDRAAMYREGRDLLAKVPELQADMFDKLPPHLRGELWAQLAFASDRLGEPAARDQALENMLTKLPGTPYESRARSWQKPGNIAKEKDYTCMSCHDPGRLAPTLARLNAAGKK
jgi:hypothetical protein